MADFVQKSVTKSSGRTLTTKWDTIVNFGTLMQSIITNNPWGCTSYASAGETLAGVRQTSGYYAGKVVYTNTSGKQVGSITVKGPDSTAFSTGIATVLAATAITEVMGGTPSHDSSEDSFNCALTCHDPNGEVYKVTFTRDSVSVSGYEADSILTTIETWADSQPALA